MNDEVLELDLALRELGSLLLGDASLTATLERVTGVACRCVAAGAGSTVTLIRGGSPYTAAGSDDRGRAIDERQYELREGPCIDALKTGEAHGADDICIDGRWSELAPVAGAIGVRSLLALPLLVNGEVAGVLNMYSDREGAFGREAIKTARLVADQAAITVANAQTLEECRQTVVQLQEALDTRVVIEQAKGVLMERESWSADDAFDALRRASQNENRRIRLVAADVVTSAGRGRR